MQRFYSIPALTLLILAGLALSGCANLPGIAAGNAARNTAWPEILPMHLLLADTGNAADIRNPDGFSDTVVQRVNRLKARAQALQTPVIDPRRRALLLAALARRG